MPGWVTTRPVAYLYKNPWERIDTYAHNYNFFVRSIHVPFMGLTCVKNEGGGGTQSRGGQIAHAHTHTHKCAKVSQLPLIENTAWHQM